MANNAHRTSSSRKNKPAPVFSDYRPKRSPEMLARLVQLGVPAALAAEFPLTPHPTGRWQKKIKGKGYFFGRLADGNQAALDRYKAERDDLLPAASRRHGTRPA